MQGQRKKKLKGETVKRISAEFKNTFRKHAYSNIPKILPPKNEKKKSDKNSDIFYISAQNIDCGYSVE